MILAGRGRLRRHAGTRATGDAAEAAYGWFLGDNDVGLRGRGRRRPAAATTAWAERGVNENQGAESTLMWLTAVETHARSCDGTADAVRAQARRAEAPCRWRMRP